MFDEIHDGLESVEVALLGPVGGLDRAGECVVRPEQDFVAGLGDLVEFAANCEVAESR